jgi:DNA-binding transcriptional MerR regulator
MLRHYDRVGLLAPQRIDPATGYRLYHIDQLAQLKRICVLRDLAFSIEEIAVLLADDAPTATQRHVLKTKRHELAGRITADVARLRQIDARLRPLSAKDGYPMTLSQSQLCTLLMDHYALSPTAMTYVYGDADTQRYRITDDTQRPWDLLLSRADGLVISKVHCQALHPSHNSAGKLRPGLPHTPRTEILRPASLRMTMSREVASRIIRWPGQELARRHTARMDRSAASGDRSRPPTARGSMHTVLRRSARAG